MRAGTQASDRDRDPDQNGVAMQTQLWIGIAIRIDLSGSTYPDRPIRIDLSRSTYLDRPIWIDLSGSTYPDRNPEHFVPLYSSLFCVAMHL